MEDCGDGKREDCEEEVDKVMVRLAEYNFPASFVYQKFQTDQFGRRRHFLISYYG